MGNCLVTKLKGVVDNDNLPKYGELLIRVPSGNVEAFNSVYPIGCFTDVTLTTTGDIQIWDYFETVNHGNTFHYVGGNVPDATAVMLKGTNGEIHISGKYNMRPNGNYSPQLYDTVFDNTIDSLKYWFKGDLVSFDVILGKSHAKGNYCMRTGDLKDLIPLAPLRKIQVGYCINVTGNISDLYVHKDTLTEFSCYGTKVTGSLEDLGEFINLDSFNANNGIHLNDITGTVEGFVARQRAAGRTSATFNIFDARSTKITFNGQPQTTTGTELSWDATTITCNGVTITA